MQHMAHVWDLLLQGAVTNTGLGCSRTKTAIQPYLGVSIM